MIGQHGQWRNLGRLLVADRRYPWFCSHTGACAAVATDDPDRFDFFITVRDDANRSVIGRGALNLKWSGGNVDVQVTVEPTPALQHGELGMFDENGVSYPWVVAADGRVGPRDARVQARDRARRVELVRVGAEHALVVQCFGELTLPSAPGGAVPVMESQSNMRG